MADDKQEVKNSGKFLWLEKEVVPKIAGVLGKDSGEFSCEIKTPTDGFFISSIYMVDLISSSGCETKEKRYRLVIKVQPEDENRRNVLRTDILFHNEILFYQRFGRNYINYPKCVFIIREPIDEAMIVLENVTQFGYKPVPSKELLGMKHALAFVQEIGRFHAQGYVLKERSPDEFFGAVKELRTIYDDTADPVLVEFYNTMSLRPVNYLRSVNYDPEFCDKISICLSDTYRILTDCMKPRNELAVLCHGDFTANNVLFKEEDDGKLKAILIDFAQVRYVSPATDVSTFLYVSCKEEVWGNFGIVYRAYHDAMLEYLEEHGVQDLQRYSFDAFLDDYKKHAISGCAIAICSAPLFCFGNAEFPDFGFIINNKSEFFEAMMATGGDKVSKRLADMLVEFRKNGWLTHLM